MATTMLHQESLKMIIRVISLILLYCSPTSAWVSLPHRGVARTSLPSQQTSQRLYLSSLNNNDKNNLLVQEEGERIICDALIQAGCQQENFNVAWGSESVVVTISGSTFLQDDDAEDDDAEDDDAEDDDAEGDDEIGMDDEPLAKETTPTEGFNLVELSRAIHAALDVHDEGSVGWQIGTNYEIEVTTPGAPNELSGIMFEAYKGFDVMVEFKDPKNNKSKRVDGRLVERNDVFTVINVKGRMSNIRNDMVQSVRLPKAKKEKGSR
jgi:hypothetical protein